MTRPFTCLSFVAAALLCAVAGAPTALGVETCPNEQLRLENQSTALPDCRAYELVTADSNHAIVEGFLGSRVSRDGGTIIYVTADAPEVANSGAAASNYVRSERDPRSGWHGESLAPPLVGPVTAYQSFTTSGIASNFSSTVLVGNQPLSGATEPAGFKLFISQPDGSWRLITPVAGAAISAFGFLAGNSDFSRVYFQSGAPQLPAESTSDENTYEWSGDDGLKLLGVLPDGTPSANSVHLVGLIGGPISADGKRAVFTSEGKLYLRDSDAPTLEASVSQRTVEPDPNPGPSLSQVSAFDPRLQAGSTVDGSKVLFVARSELTNDANTGRSGGVATDAGADLYSYEVAAKKLSDLTVDTNPADVATGADVQQVLGATPDGSYIYFTANGRLASGATPGRSALYVWHDGEVNFVADAEGLQNGPQGGLATLYVTPNGQHVAFESTESLTAYNNNDPVTGRPHDEVYEATIGAGVMCVSCRPDGTSPTADSNMPHGQARGTLLTISDDGSRVFFQSTDAVIPQATGNSFQKVFEYASGRVALLSSPSSHSDTLMQGASATGEDVFLATYDELVPNPNGGDSAVYDARIEGGFPVPSRPSCAGIACRGALSPTPVLAASASGALPGAGNLAPHLSASKATPTSVPQTRRQKLTKALKACKTKHNKKKRASCEKVARKRYGRSK